MEVGPLSFLLTPSRPHHVWILREGSHLPVRKKAPTRPHYAGTLIVDFPGSESVILKFECATESP